MPVIQVPVWQLFQNLTFGFELQEGKLHKEDVVQNMYSLHPAYLEASLDLSLERMNLQAVSDSKFLYAWQILSGRCKGHGGLRDGWLSNRLQQEQAVHV
jgi:hypothetical protein